MAPYGNSLPNSVPVVVSHMDIQELGQKLDNVVKQIYAFIDESKRDVQAARQAGREIDKSFHMGKVNGMILALEHLCKTMDITLRIKD